MSVKAMFAIGFLSLVAATGVMNASGSFASDASRESALERIGHGGSTYQAKSVRAGDCQSKADVVERIGHGGSTYQSKASDCNTAGAAEKRMDVVKRIGHGGTVYSSNQTLTN